MFRLHLDCPLGTNEEWALELSECFKILLKSWLSNQEIFAPTLSPEEASLFLNGLQIRLGNDGDRGNRNYLNKDFAGHATTKKMKLS